MDLVAKIILLVCGAVAFTVNLLPFVHMMQLNSYMPDRYRGWRRANLSRVFGKRLVAPILVLAACVLSSHWWVMLSCAAVLLLGAAISRPPRAKKPLVYTARVKRQLITAAILTVGICVGLWFCPSYAFTAGIVLLIVTAPWLAACVLWITQPMEQMIAQRYVRAARRKLQEMPRTLVIGITGSYGKTSTKYFLHDLLSVRYNVQMTPESYNTLMGVVRTIREQLRPSAEIFLAEMGAKNVGDIKEICDLVHPHMGIITSIGEQHLETFGSLDNIIATKFELADSLPQDGTLVLNYDNEYIRQKQVTVPTVCYGIQQRPDNGYYADDIQVDLTGSSFTVHTPQGESRRFTTCLLGEHNIQNLVGCISIAHQLSIPLEDLVYPVRRLKPVPHRLQLMPGGYIDDAYNSNPAGFRSALRVLKSFNAQRILVTPGMVELGERQHALNRELGAFAADCCDFAVLVGKRQAPPLQEGLLSAGFDPANLYVAEDLQDALRFVRALPDCGQRIVLLENDLPDNF